MKMKNWLKTTLAIGLVVATGGAFVGCGGNSETVKGEEMDFASGAQAMAKTSEYTQSSITEADKDTGFTMDFSAAYKDYGANTEGSIDAQLIGSGKKDARVYELTIDPQASFGSLMKVNMNLKLTAAKYDNSVIFYNQSSKEKIDLSPIAALIAASNTGDASQSTGGTVELDSAFKTLLGAMNSMMMTGIDESTAADILTPSTQQAEAGKSKTDISAKFLKTSGENSYVFTITSTTTAWAQKEGAASAIDLDTTVVEAKSVYTINDGKITKLETSEVTKLNNKTQLERSLGLGIKYSAKKLTAVSKDELAKYKDIIADSNLFAMLSEFNFTPSENNDPINSNDNTGNGAGGNTEGNTGGTDTNGGED